MEITRALPDAASILELEPEELAPYLLEHLSGNRNHLAFGNFFATHSGGVGKHYNGDARVEQAFREAWSWLLHEGLLYERDNWSAISRRGERLKSRQDVANQRRSNVLPRASLHPTIAERVWSSFVRGDFEAAVFLAFKEVEVCVRKAAGYPDTEIGIVLMGKAFKVSVGPLTDRSLPEAEQLAMVNLFTGAVGLFKNPSSHRHVVLKEPREAAEMVGFASLLMRIVDSRARAARTEPTA